MLPESKTAETAHEVLDLIKLRWSPRAFDSKPIDQATLNTLFEAMRWAPSAMNEQPWRVIYTNKGEDAHQQIVDALMPGNQPWAVNAPVLLVTVVKKTYTMNGAANGAARHDLGLAVGNLSLQATHEGISMHQMGGIYSNKLQEIFNLPEDFEPVTVIALGYVGDPESLPEDLKARELAKRTRKTIDEFTFHGNFKG